MDILTAVLPWKTMTTRAPHRGIAQLEILHRGPSEVWQPPSVLAAIVENKVSFNLPITNFLDDGCQGPFLKDRERERSVISNHILLMPGSDEGCQQVKLGHRNGILSSQLLWSPFLTTVTPLSLQWAKPKTRLLPVPYLKTSSARNPRPLSL
jgi:hypothetical protein